MTHPRRILTFALAAICLTCSTGRAQTSQPASQPAGRLQFDLASGLKTALVTTSYDDDGVSTDADADRKLVFLPFALQPFGDSEREVIFATGNIKMEPDNATAKKKPRLVGFRQLAVKDGRPLPIGRAAGPIFEKISVFPRRKGGVVIEAANTKRPPGAAKSGARAKPKNPEAARRGVTPLTPEDWVALIIEVDSATRRVDVALQKDTPVRIDVAYLAEAAAPFKPTERSTASDPVLRTTIDMSANESGPMATLALARLAAWRSAFDNKTPRGVIDAVAQNLTEGLGHADLAARREAWHAFVKGPKLSETDVSALLRATPAARAAIVEFAAADLPRAAGDQRAAVLQLLNLAWRAANSDIAGRVITLVIANPEADVFAALDNAPPEAVEALFARAKDEPRKSIRAGLLRALIGQTSVEREAAVLAEARALGLELVDPNDPLFTRFTTANDPRVKIGILKSLAVVSAAALHQTPEFARFADDATNARADAAVRQTAFQMAIDQATMAAIPRDMQPFGAWPLQSAAGIDGLSVPLMRAASAGAPQTRLDALALLIERGEFAVATEAIRAQKLTPDGLAALLGKLKLHTGIAQADGLTAFLLHAATHLERAAAPIVFRRLDDIAAGYPQGSRWRLDTAARCGADFTKLITLSTDRDPAVAAAAIKWLGIAAHLSAKETGLIASNKRAKERTAALAKINAERAAPERFGCLIVVEIVEPLDAVRFGAAPTQRWSAPRRASLFGPIVAVQNRDGQIVFAAGGGPVGGGLLVKPDAKLPDAKIWPPALALATWKVPGAGFDRKRSPIQFAPLALPGGSEPTESGEGNVTIDAAKLIRAGLANLPREPLDGLSRALPDSFKIALKPIGFGALAGTAPSHPPTGSGPVLLNVLVVLQPLE